MTAAVRAEPMPSRQPAPIPFTRLLRAEWLKTTGARAARWLLAAAALIAVAAEAIPLLFPHNVKQSGASYLTWAGRPDRDIDSAMDRPGSSRSAWSGTLRREVR
jgi:hypothetical protein